MPERRRPNNKKEEESISKQKRLIYPVQKKEVEILLQESHRNPEILYRSLTESGENSPIKFDRNSLPAMKKNILPSYAYHLGGWRKVRGIVQDAETIEHLIRESDGGSYDSPLLWTSSDMTWAGAFGNPDNKDGVFTIIHLDQSRTIVRLPDYKTPKYDELSDREYDRLMEGVKRNNPFAIYTEESDIDEPSMIQDEILVGPYIMQSEVISLIRVHESHADEFWGLLKEIQQST